MIAVLFAITSFVMCLVENFAVSMMCCFSLCLCLFRFMFDDGTKIIREIPNDPGNGNYFFIFFNGILEI